MFWLAGLLVFAVILNSLAGMLMPFVAGIAIAYFLDPLANKLVKLGASRALATTVIIAGFFIAAIGLLILLFPLLQAQVVGLAAMIPDLIEKARAYAAPLLERLQSDLAPDAVERLKSAAGSYAGAAIKWVSGIVGEIWKGGVAFFSVLSLIVITPVVAFYLLRDYEQIVSWVDGYLPRTARTTIHEQARAIDAAIAGFVRGQALVCLVLATWYGAALTMVGLDAGLLVGLGAGAISIITYVGASIGLIVGVSIALAQFPEWAPIGVVALIFIIGQTAESYILTPRLVGGRIGLHPVWIIFALMAGGALFGFTGVLLAVPTAAIIGVLLRFGLKRYRESPLFMGDA